MATPARRRFAQHFLEATWIDRVVTAIGPTADQTFLEIGAGRGALTRALAARVGHVVAVEIDRALGAALRRTMPANVTVHVADILSLDLDSIPALATPRLRVAGNLPYNIGSPIVRMLLAAGGGGQRLQDATIMLQSEVADRITAAAGSRAWGPLAIATAIQAEATRLLTLPPGAFRPMPEVHSALVHLRFRPSPVAIVEPSLLDEMVRALFHQPRKYARNALRPFLAGRTTLPPDRVLARAGIDPRSRPADLGLPELAVLSAVVAAEQH